MFFSATVDEFRESFMVRGLIIIPLTNPMADPRPVLVTNKELKSAVEAFLRKARKYYNPKRWGSNPKLRPSTEEYLEVSSGLFRLDKAFEESRADSLV